MTVTSISSHVVSKIRITFFSWIMNALASIDTSSLNWSYSRVFLRCTPTNEGNKTNYHHIKFGATWFRDRTIWYICKISRVIRVKRLTHTECVPLFIYLYSFLFGDESSVMYAWISLTSFFFFILFPLPVTVFVFS